MNKLMTPSGGPERIFKIKAEVPEGLGPPEAARKVHARKEARRYSDHPAAFAVDRTTVGTPGGHKYSLQTILTPGDEVYVRVGCSAFGEFFGPYAEGEKYFSDAGRARTIDGVVPHGLTPGPDEIVHTYLCVEWYAFVSAAVGRAEAVGPEKVAALASALDKAKQVITRNAYDRSVARSLAATARRRSPSAPATLPHPQLATPAGLGPDKTKKLDPAGSARVAQPRTATAAGEDGWIDVPGGLQIREVKIPDTSPIPAPARRRPELPAGRGGGPPEIINDNHMSLRERVSAKLERESGAGGAEARALHAEGRVQELTDELEKTARALLASLVALRKLSLDLLEVYELTSDAEVRAAVSVLASDALDTLSDA